MPYSYFMLREPQVPSKVSTLVFSFLDFFRFLVSRFGLQVFTLIITQTNVFFCFNFGCFYKKVNFFQSLQLKLNLHRNSPSLQSLQHQSKVRPKLVALNVLAFTYTAQLCKRNLKNIQIFGYVFMIYLMYTMLS